MTSSASTRMVEASTRLSAVRKRVELHLAQRLVEHAAGPGQEVVPERPAAPHEVLPQPGLRLVQADRRGLAHRRPEVLGVEALLVERVPDLVQHGQDAAGEVAGREARR